jgi:uncharacterized iron-regulated membrane protein
MTDTYAGGSRQGPPISDGGDSHDGRPVSPPVQALAIAAALVAVGAALGFSNRTPLHALGYLVSMFGGLGCVAWFKREDSRRRQNVFYAPERKAQRLVPALLVASVVVAAVNAWAIATFLAAR